jgi:hypothetical protein
MIKQSDKIDKLFRQLSVLIRDELNDELTLNKNYNYKSDAKPYSKILNQLIVIADEVVSDSPTYAEKNVKDKTSQYVAFTRGMNFHKSLYGREVWYHRYDKKVFLFVGTEDEIVERIKTAFDLKLTEILIDG